MGEDLGGVVVWKGVKILTIKLLTEHKQKYLLSDICLFQQANTNLNIWDFKATCVFLTSFRKQNCLVFVVLYLVASCKEFQLNNNTKSNSLFQASCVEVMHNIRNVSICQATDKLG
eukprot:TRINITY_DN4412_c0_g1_i2.p6 TRINITY_DN4412_c0_g1~~TRINITY_DN4412_c0_g1_i2.p6  ORF type:complete len:116 (-),score=4.11 TRINITY_DN4412_c0_g1_i2:1139-1486(-)